MNRYVLGVLLFMNFWVNYASAIESATISISYVEGEISVFDSKLEVYSYRRTDVVTAEEIMDHMNDKADLDEFAKLRLYLGTREVAPKHMFTMEALRQIGGLTVRFNINDNSPEAILDRRITWLVDQIAGESQNASEDWMKIRMVRAFVEENHLDESGRQRSLRKILTLWEVHDLAEKTTLEREC
jgi:hypothetical protein